MYKRPFSSTGFTENKRPKTLQDYFLLLYKDPLTTSNSIEGLYQVAVKYNKYEFSFTKEDIRLFLLSQSTYQKQQPLSNLKQQKRTGVSGKNLKWQMDLIDLHQYANNNENVKYLLTIIDVFSKYAMVFLLENKRGETVASILQILFPNLQPKILLSDNGKEFLNTNVKQIIDQYIVHHFTSYPYTSLGIIERFNKTIKSKIFTYMQINQTRHYVDVLDQLVQNYNKTKHSTIKEQPSYVEFCDERQRDCGEAHKRIYTQLQYIDEKINALNSLLHIKYFIKLKIQNGLMISKCIKMVTL